MSLQPSRWGIIHVCQKRVRSAIQRHRRNRKKTYCIHARAFRKSYFPVRRSNKQRPAISVAAIGESAALTAAHPRPFLGMLGQCCLQSFNTPRDMCRHAPVAANAFWWHPCTPVGVLGILAVRLLALGLPHILSRHSHLLLDLGIVGDILLD